MLPSVCKYPLWTIYVVHCTQAHHATLLHHAIQTKPDHFAKHISCFVDLPKHRLLLQLKSVHELCSHRWASLLALRLLPWNDVRCRFFTTIMCCVYSGQCVVCNVAIKALEHNSASALLCWRHTQPGESLEIIASHACKHEQNRANLWTSHVVL